MRKFSVCHICFIKEKNVWTPTCFPQAPAKRLFQYSIETILHYLYLEIGILQTSRSIGRKSCQSCLRCIAWLVFEVTVLAKLMVTLLSMVSYSWVRLQWLFSHFPSYNKFLLSLHCAGRK